MWSISKRKKKNDSGMTLVELLVAFAVSAIVLSGLSYVIFSVLQFYGRANANVEIQNESQASLNLVIDSIIAAKGVCFVEEDSAAVTPDGVTCALFGTLDLDDTGMDTMTFTGDAILWQPGCKEMYLISGTFELGRFSSESEAPLEAIEEMKKALPADRADRLRFLMAQNVTAFELKADDNCFVEPLSKPEDEMTEEEKKKAGKRYFENPLTIHINMEFEYEYQSGKMITRQMDDNVAVRNRMDYVYIQREGEYMTKYLRNQG